MKKLFLSAVLITGMTMVSFSQGTPKENQAPAHKTTTTSGQAQHEKSHGKSDTSGHMAKNSKTNTKKGSSDKNTKSHKNG